MFHALEAFAWILFATLSGARKAHSQNCIFTDITQQYVLDLSKMNGLNLSYSDDDYHYTYSVCSNDLFCNVMNDPREYYVSITQYYLNECWWLATYNSSVIPTYNVGTQTWSFKYEGMWCSDLPQYSRNTTVNWRCNDKVEYKILSIAEVGTCQYEVDVESMYACLETPEPYCAWTEGAQTLDLSSLSNDFIVGNDNAQTNLVFTYTPCQNATLCRDERVMAKLDDTRSDNGCNTSLAVWESANNGGTPAYDENNKVWRFEYENGGMCDGMINALYVYWVCNPEVPKYRVVKAEAVELCLYDISIESALACT